MRKVILIGGTSYSGSTMLDLILANDPAGFSCGETVCLFRPFRQHHFNPKCICGDAGCQIWNVAKRRGRFNFYQGLFSDFPELNFIIDSSKDYTWIGKQAKALSNQAIRVENVLIWKHPAEFALSCLKRNRSIPWRDMWVKYHERYFSVVERFVSVSYSQFLECPEDSLQKLYWQVQVPYFEGKIEYWNKCHHTLFGSKTATYHLHEPGSPEFLDAARHLMSHSGIGSDATRLPVHRRISREPLKRSDVHRQIEKRMAGDVVVGRILEILKATSTDQEPDWENVRRKVQKVAASRTFIWMKNLRQEAHSLMFRRNGRGCLRERMAQSG